MTEQTSEQTSELTESDALFDVSEPSPEETKAADEWFWSEGNPGEGPRPDFLSKKYNTVADAAKGQMELEKKLGAFTGAPEEYDTENLDIDTEQHVFKQISDLGKELNLNQEGFDKLVTKLLVAQEAEKNVDIEAELKKLGNEGDRMMRQYKHFAENHLEGEEAEIVSDWIQTPGDLKIFNELVQGVYAKRLPTDTYKYINTSTESVSTLRDEMAKNIKKYDSDPKYREEYSLRLKAAQQKEMRGQG